MSDRISIFKLGGLPEAFATVLLLVALIFFLAPYFAGADFGVLKVPGFTERAKKRLKLIGPLLLVSCVSFFVPVIPLNGPPPPANTTGTPSAPATFLTQPAASPTRSLDKPATPLPLSTPPAHSTGGDIQVWVNTDSGIYHCPRTKWYGTTKEGEYMTQAEAQERNHRPAYGKICQ